MLHVCVVILSPTKFHKASANITSAIALPCCKGKNYLSTKFRRKHLRLFSCYFVCDANDLWILKFDTLSEMKNCFLH